MTTDKDLTDNAGRPMRRPVETQRQRRGHDFYPPASELAGLPALYETDGGGLADKVIYLHYFVGGCDWWLAEIDPEHWHAYGYVNLGDLQCAEWGYVDLTELETIKIHGWLVVERDLYWTPCTAREAKLPGNPY